MNLPRLSLLAAALLLPGLSLRAQTDDDANETPPPPGSTIIHSNELHADQASHISVFDGNVVVDGTNFKMTCQEMTVYFTNDNKVDHIVATGNVVITQPGRVTNCGHAEYFHDDDKFVLTEEPEINDHGNQVTGTQITIYRTTQKMVVDHGPSKVIIGPGNMSAPANTSAPSSP